MKKLMFALLLVATQTFYASSQQNAQPTTIQLSPDTTLTRSTNPFNGQLVVTYTYNNPSSILLTSVVSYHTDESFTTHDTYRN